MRLISSRSKLALVRSPDIEPQALRFAAVFDDELQQDETFARIAEVRAWFEMDMQLLVGFDEPEVS